MFTRTWTLSYHNFISMGVNSNHVSSVKYYFLLEGIRIPSYVVLSYHITILRQGKKILHTNTLLK